MNTGMEQADHPGDRVRESARVLPIARSRFIGDSPLDLIIRRKKGRSTRGLALARIIIHTRAHTHTHTHARTWFITTRAEDIGGERRRETVFERKKKAAFLLT